MLANKPNSSQESIARIKKMIWLPIATLFSVFLVCATVLVWEDVQLNMESLESQVTELVASEETLFVNEIFLGQEQAITMRLERIANRLKSYMPHATVCLRVVAKEFDTTPSSRCNISAPESFSTISTLSVGDEIIGTVQAHIKVAWLANKSLVRLIVASLISFAIAFLIVQLLGRRIELKIVAPLVARIEQRSREIGAARISQMFVHDIRRPYHLIRAMLDRLAKSKEVVEITNLVRRFRPEIDQSLDRIDLMMADIMFDGDRAVEHNKAPVSLHKLLGSVFDQLQEEIPKSVVLRKNLIHQSMLEGDWVQLQRVFTNILQNALQATPAEGTIWVNTEQQPDTIKITIGNTGSFIPKIERDRIFDMFYTRGKKSGTGLGLAICRKIIQSHGGKIWVESSRLYGTEFTMTIPADLGADNKQLQDVSLDNKSKCMRFVVVDDSPFILDAWRNVDGLTVDCFLDLESLRKRMTEEDWDWDAVDGFITDYYFDQDHGQTGTDLAKEVRSSGYKGKIIIYSSAPNRDIVARHDDLVFVSKEVSPEILVQQLS